jgi:hypothetical protein
MLSADRPFGRNQVVRKLAVIAAVTLGATGVSLAHAEDAFYLGTWKFDSAVVAPWTDPHTKPDPKDKNALMGKTVTFTAKAITGPADIACKGPKYKVTNYTADMLFQGAFEEMHDNNKSADPLKLAASLGFIGTAFKTLETGCEIDWHFVDMSTVEIGLNDYVYTLKKQ